MDLENMQINNINSMIRIAKKYYELNMSQEEISLQEEISKSSVSRMLKKAAMMGFVRHEIVYPIKSVAQQEQLIRQMFDIEHLFIVPKMVDDLDIRLSDTCRTVAQDLNRFISDREIVSVSWGRTIEKLSSLLVAPVPPKKGIKIVQLNGSIATSVLSTKTAGILERFTEAYSGVGYILAAPAFVDNEDIASAIKMDSRIRSVLDMARESTIAVFGVGQLSEQSVLVERGAITSDDVRILSGKGAVGDVCSRFFDINGKAVDQTYEARTIGMDLDDLKKKKHRIGIAVGIEKADAIIGALAGKLMTSLYMDEMTASFLITRAQELGY